MKTFMNVLKYIVCDAVSVLGKYYILSTPIIFLRLFLSVTSKKCVVLCSFGKVYFHITKIKEVKLMVGLEEI